MKINEVIKEAYNNPTQSKYTGKNYFMKSVTNQIFAYIDSARQAGHPIKSWDFVQGYMSKFGWHASPEQATQLKAMCNQVDAEYNKYYQQQDQQSSTEPTMEGKLGDFAKAAGAGAMDWGKKYLSQKAGQLASKVGFGLVNKLANLMYMVGMSQARDPRTGAVLKTQGSQQQAPQDTDIAPQTEKILQSLKPLKGAQFENDLEEIVKLALWNLYGTNKSEYNNFFKRIAAGDTKKNPQQTVSIGGEKLDPKDPKAAAILAKIQT